MVSDQHPGEAAQALKALRERSGLSVGGVAKLLKRPKSTYSEKELAFKGRYLPVEWVEALASVLPGYGQPPITREEVLALGGRNVFVPNEAGKHLPGTLPPSNVRPAEDKPPLPERHMMPRDVPVYGTAAGGNGDGCFELNQGEPIDFVRRGPGIEMARDVYCIYVEGESMVPWKEPGDMIYLDPARKVRIGDYVVLVVDGPTRGEPPRAYLKRLVRRSPEQTTFQQYNPAKDVIFDTRLIKSMTRVLTMEEVLGV